MSTDTSRPLIEHAANLYMAHYAESSLQAWEQLHGQVRADELTSVRETCATQRYIDDCMRTKLRAQEMLNWLVRVAEDREAHEQEVADWHEVARNADVNAENAFIALRVKAQKLLTWTRIREKLEVWILGAYLKKVMSGRGVQLSEAEQARKESFHDAVEYSVGGIEDGMEGWFQLHNLALDETSAIRAAMAGSVSLFPGEE
ncbi:uncharacterized protein K460DRAFT_401059 [Cucurbitaria berberidis CBS 394.84]|uniref:Uncharacterized protein n=1 Tax=Cucurbitaria berberidis CBS 394.84 TaxID=1168544 RepID=A0A9P4GSJ9_9PLEO|nr:uncharacterized protein K460DRAFT_401059 [Cucurbitaria berberidis CBS 394.84]KAF1851027.1 hypothetical protein K460DRAFT_401059 [Cucurbitaria berberidis CBS 394.84]